MSATTTHQHVAQLRALYSRPDPEALRRQLAACADGIHAAIAEATQHPTPCLLEQLAIRLDAVRVLSLRLRGALVESAEEVTSAPRRT
jgi:hypothetical protein